MEAASQDISTHNDTTAAACTTGSAQRPGGPELWTCSGDVRLRTAFGRGKAGRKRRLAWVAKLPDDQKFGIADRWGKLVAWEVSDAARLPEDGPAGGKTVGEVVQNSAFRRIPAEKQAGMHARRAVRRLFAQGTAGREALRRWLAKQPGRANPDLIPGEFVLPETSKAAAQTVDQ